MQKRGQAALEFLTTYAWTFVIVIIVVGAIAYFGLLRPTKVLPDRCIFNVDFGCEAYSASSNGNFNFKLRNQLDSNINVNGIELRLDDGTNLSCVSTQVPDIIVAQNSSVMAWTNCAFAGSYSKGDKVKMEITLNYYQSKTGASYPKVAEGEALFTLT